MKSPLAQRAFPDSPLRRVVRHSALEGLSRLGRFTGSTDQHLAVNRVHFLYLHFMPESDVDRFRELLREIRKTHIWLDYSSAVRRIREGSIDAPYVAISFDDGFVSNFRAAEVLSDEGISACFFVCPGLVGRNRAELGDAFPRALGDEARTLTWAEIEKLAEAGHEIGSHTTTHPNLAALPHDQAAAQIVDSKAELQARLGGVEHFAWPFGQFHHFTNDLMTFVYQTGYESCASAERGAHSAPLASEQDLCVRREHVDTSWPNEHVRYFMARSASRMTPGMNYFPGASRMLA